MNNGAKKVLILNSPVPRPKVLYFNDFWVDLDGAFALALFLYYESRGLCDLVGLVGDEWGTSVCPFIDTITSFWNRADLPIGMIPRPYEESFDAIPITGAGFDDILGACSQDNGNYEESTAMVRRLLSEADDSSITICTAGPVRGLSQALASGANYGGDGLGTGLSLVTAKVKQLNLGGGDPNLHGGTNLTADPSSASYVVLNWPSEVPIVFVGENCSVGYNSPDAMPIVDPGWIASNPLKYLSMAALDYGGNGLWETSDPIRAVFTVLGLRNFLRMSAKGTAVVQPGGDLTFTEDGLNNHYCLYRSAGMTNHEVATLLAQQLLLAGAAAEAARAG